eukprot:365395-Chlamydomonas_euryale.AAC.6
MHPSDRAVPRGVHSPHASVRRGQTTPLYPHSWTNFHTYPRIAATVRIQLVRPFPPHLHTSTPPHLHTTFLHCAHLAPRRRAHCGNRAQPVGAACRRRAHRARVDTAQANAQHLLHQPAYKRAVRQLGQ